jgi:hypothetical protein
MLKKINILENDEIKKPLVKNGNPFIIDSLKIVP